ncbi:hypothetical protein BJ322DRAFT_163192 [Thelephora terrestris]|uniref:Uncharacterized protein n=1 Tax=Thelephora terrestris TaxID=56493 RepID=A0A9P6HBZ8_9AGAM|nr:hypothetical protein BJ322DRAFT_163192 [Thelephora terrestris]
MTTRSYRNKRGGSQEGSPLAPGQQGSTSYGSAGPVPRAPILQSPPPYSATLGYSREGNQEIRPVTCRRNPPPLRPPAMIGRIVGAAAFFILVTQFVAFVFFYDLPAKIGRYAEVTVRMRKEATHLESERAALQEERKHWEKAREDRVPQGAFWEVAQPALDCLSYGKREYWGILRNIPEDWTDLDACMNMPVEIKGLSVRRPDRCLYVKDSPYIHGFWTVDWDQPDCKPWLQDFDDKGCTNKGSGTRRIEAWVVGINEKGGQDWRLLCESMPITWNHITYNTPTHCDARWTGRKVAMWDIPDESC